jgi:hypothetical protein
MSSLGLAPTKQEGRMIWYDYEGHLADVAEYKRTRYSPAFNGLSGCGVGGSAFQWVFDWCFGR